MNNPFDQRDKHIKFWDKWAYVLSGIIIMLVILMRRVKIDLGMDFWFLPPFHASLNAFAAVCLIIAYIKIRKKNIIAHKGWIIAALVCSVLFLISYVIYHFTTEETSFCKEGPIRYVYFFLLITHVFLAGIILPFILITFIRGYFLAVERHRKLAKRVFPVWLYVAISGPIVYLMLMPCYGS